MNLSGKSLMAVKHFFKIEPEDIIVIHDDIDLPFGAVLFKKGGGHGGHNGLRSIDQHIGKEYLRVRIGIGKPEYKTQVAEYVLHDFDAQEKKDLDKLIQYVAEACKDLNSETLNKVKSQYSIKSISGLKEV